MRARRTAAGRPVPLFGRERERQRLLGLIESGVEGHGGAALVVGDAGIGKTRLLQAVADDARERAAVVWGRASRHEDTPDLWPWMQVLRAVSRLRPRSALRASTRSAAILARVVPDLADVLGVTADTGETTPFEVRDAIATTLLHAAHEEPLVVLLDDLHDADAASLDLLTLLHEQVAASRLAIVAASRPVEDATILSDLAARADVLVLAGLDADCVAALARDAGHPLDRAAALDLHRQTGGNPFFVLEAAAAAEGGVIATAGVPLAVRGLVEQRLQALAPATRLTLAATAVLGDAANEVMLAEVAGSASEDLLEDLKTLADLGLAQRVPDLTATWAVAHDLLRDAVLDLITSQERQHLEAAAAQALAHRHGDDPVAAATIARHLLDAGSQADPLTALPYLRRAADHAAQRLAWAEAARLHGEALQVLRTHSSDDDAVLTALLAVGNAQARGTHPESARTTFQTAIEVARRLGDTDRLAIAVLGACQADRRAPGLDMEASRLLPELDEALAALAGRPDDDAVRARLLATRALHQSLAGDADGIEDIAAAAVEAADRAGDLPAQAVAAASHRWAQGPLVPLQQRRQATERLATLATAADDLEMQWVARRWQLVDALQAADPAGAAAAVDACLALSTRLGEPYLTALSLVWQGTLALLQGRFGDLQRHTERALAAAQAAEGAGVDTIGGQQIFRMRDQGELDPAALDALAEQYPAEYVLRALRAWGHAHAGSLEQANDVLVEMVAAGLDRLPQSEYWLATLAMLAEVAARVRSPEAAAPLLRLLSAVPDQCVLTAGGPMAWTGPLSYFTGLLRLVLGEPAAAIADLERALATAERMAARPSRARIGLALAAARTAAGDTRRASADLAASKVLAESLGMGWLTTMQQAFQDEVGLVTPAPSPADLPVREAVLRPAARGWLVGTVDAPVTMPPAKGLGYLHVLLSCPQTDVHVLDLVAGHTAERATTSGDLAVRRGSSAGPVLDEQAIAAYRRRLENLDEEIATAATLGDDSRAERAESERDALLEQLAGAVGLGGRRRTAADDTERARVNVTRAIRTAISRIRHVDTTLADHLSASVRTGRCCTYTPDPTSPITWRLHE